jgi:Uncharacterised nucleotidyltransferase
MSSPLTLENRLILACARTDPDVQHIQELVERGPDWQGILRKAERWGLAPLVYANLRQAAPSGQVPKPVTDRLRHLFHRDTIHGVAKRELLRATLLHFSEASVPVIVLKGAALAALVYPSPTLRPMGDVDLLVHGHDLDRADELLRGMGDAHHAIPYLGPEGFSLLDVRDEICSRGGSADRLPAAVRIPIEDFWKRARPARIESVATLVFSPEDLLLDLALHLASHLSETDGFVGHLGILCDIGETCRRYGDAIDWSRLVTQAEAYQVGKELYYALRLARDLVGAGVPSRALTDLRARFGQLPLEDRFIAAVTRDAILSEDQSTGPPSTFYTLGVHLLATHRARDGVIIACRLLARSCRVRLRRLVIGPGPWRARFTGSGGSDLSVGAGPSEARSSGASRKVGESTPRPRAQGGHAMHTLGEVAVTYDQGNTDGVGAQLQRIYGLYALSRGLHIKYVHTPLGRVGYQGLLPLLAGRTDPDFAARYNAFFSLPSDDFDLEGCERVRVHYLDEDKVEHYREHAAATGRPVLLEAHEPYGYTDRHPAAYQALRAVSPYRGYRATGPIRVCIHLRRGDHMVQRQRGLPNAYYVRACSAVVDVLRQQGAPFVVRLHTEVPPRPYTLHPGISGLYLRLDEPATIDPAEHALEDFQALPNLEMVLNVEPREALDDFATADVLILSRSDFGYLGGLLNPHGLVISAPTYHAALPDWLVAGEQGDLDAAQVATRIAGQLRRRGQC